MTTKTPDEIKDELLEDNIKDGKGGSVFTTYQLRTVRVIIDKAFSLGVEEGKKQNKDISLCKDCNCMTYTLTICGKCKSFKLQEDKR